MRFGELSSKLNFAQQSIEKTQIGACVCVCASPINGLSSFLLWSPSTNSIFHYIRPFAIVILIVWLVKKKRHFLHRSAGNFELMLFTWNLKKWHIIWKGAIWPMDICKRSKKSLNMFRMTFDENRTKLLFTKEIWPIFPYDISRDRPLWPQ